MSRRSLKLENPIQDAISKVRFAPQSNNLLISSWDSKLRLYDVDSLKLRLEAPSEASILDCCFQNEFVAFAAGSNGFIKRYDMHSGIGERIGNHDDLSTCLEYCDNLCQLFSSGWDKKIMTWDTRTGKPCGCLDASVEVESMSISGFSLMAAVGASVNIYDLRSLNKPIHAKDVSMNMRLKCVRPIFKSKGFVVGSIDGRVSLKYLNPSNAETEGYSFRCYPKGRDGRLYLIEVNDIAFNPCIPFSFVTGDSNGYITAWDARNKKRIFELPRHPTNVTSLSYNHEGQLLAVASSCTYQEANEKLEPPQIFIHRMDDYYNRPGLSACSSVENNDV